MQETTYPQTARRTGTPTPHRTVSGHAQWNGKAVGSLVCGILGLFLGVFVLPLVLSVAAILLGISARRDIMADPTQKGNAIAMTGIVLGWIVVGLAVLALLYLAVMFVLPYFGASPDGGAPPGAGGP